MNDFLNFLFKLNNKLYSYYFHAPFLILWISSYLLGYFKGWIVAGLIVWFFMLTYRLAKEKKLVSFKKNKLGYLVGLNIAVFLGPLCLVLIYLLRFEK